MNKLRWARRLVSGARRRYMRAKANFAIQHFPERQELIDKVTAIHGWLNHITLVRTLDILAGQGKMGVTGNLMEIGVFCGKYFAALTHDAMQTNVKVLGIDTFQFASIGRVERELMAALGRDSLNHTILWERDSTKVTAAQVIDAIGRPRFISIDGAHDVDSVLQDLSLGERIISDDGIIALDDFLNPLTLGVNQAINAFLGSSRTLVPVAYISNKLFLAHQSRAADYRALIEAAIVSGPEPESALFRQNLMHGRDHVEQPFFGHQVLLS